MRHLMMNRRQALAAAGGVTATVFMPAIARANTVDIVAHYSMPAIFKEAQDAVLAAFSAKHPEVKVTYVNPTPTYEDGAQLVLRGATTNQLPDVSFQGLNRLRLFAERGIALDLGPLLQAEGDLEKLGYTKPILGLGFHGGVQCGMAFATSNPISYYN
ncbi:MAG: extracellular solute-binding protein, partial [Hyphomicrobiales bacterium]|nr:extracellular solute-binding protein [Hyphomicrobiales bacterium]